MSKGRRVKNVGGRDRGVMLEGLEEVVKRLGELPDRAKRHAVRPAINKAATPVVKAARKFAPSGTGVSSRSASRAPLKRTIVKKTKTYKKSGTIVAIIGPKKYEAPHSHLVHDGTKAHEITLTKPLVLRGAVLPAGFVIQHPGAKAQPFMDMAVNASRNVSLVILTREIVKGIDKQVQRIAMMQ